MHRSLRKPASRRPLTTLAGGLGFLLVQLEVSIVNVALPSMGAELSSGVAALQWVVDAYALAFASLLLSAGALGDRYGARKAFAAGLAVFTLASLGCGLAHGIGSLIAARVLQGTGAALLVPCSLALLNHASGGDETARIRTVSLWTAAGSLGLCAGPVLGGFLVATCGWRCIFLVNLPIGGLGIWLTSRFVEETEPREGGFDLPGQALGIVTLLALTAAMIEAGSLGWHHRAVLCGVAVASCCALAFAYVEARGRDPLLPPGIFRRANVVAASLVGLLVNLTLYGVVFILGLYFQWLRAYSPMEAGLAFLPLPVALLLANIAAGKVAAHLGPRPPMAIGLVGAAAGYLWLSPIGPATPYGAIVPGLCLQAFGIGLAVPPMTASLLAAIPRAQSGVASGILNTIRQSGGAIGVALFGSLTAKHGGNGLAAAFLLSAGLAVLGALIAAIGIRAAPLPMAAPAPRSEIASG